MVYITKFIPNIRSLGALINIASQFSQFSYKQQFEEKNWLLNHNSWPQNCYSGNKTIALDYKKSKPGIESNFYYTTSLSKKYLFSYCISPQFSYLSPHNYLCIYFGLIDVWFQGNFCLTLGI